MTNKIKNMFLWKFFEFICTYRNPLFLLLKPMIETTVLEYKFNNSELYNLSTFRLPITVLKMKKTLE